MDEFVKLSPAEKKIIDLVRSAQEGEIERFEFVTSNDGKPDTYLFTRTKKGRLSGPVLTPIK